MRTNEKYKENKQAYPCQLRAQQIWNKYKHSI